MALWLETDTNTNKDISSAVSVGVYTATGDVFVLPQILADQVAGNGDYVYYVTLQVAGAGSAYVVGPKTTHTAAAGETALAAQGGMIFMRNTDVLTVYIDGLAGDTTTPDVTVRFAAIPLPSAAAGASGGLPVLDANLVSAVNVTHSAGVAVSGRLAEATDIDAIQGADGDTLETLSDQLDDVATSVAACASVAANSTDATASGAITRKRGNSWSIALTLGEVTGYTSLWFSVKRSYDDADSAALLQVKLNNPSAADGLLYVNGAAATDATKASITVSDAATGAIVIAVDETITDDLAPGTYYYDAQMLNTGAVTTPDDGTFTITADVTRSVT